MSAIALAYASAALAVAPLKGRVALEVALEPGAEARPRAGQAFLRGPRAFVLGAVLALAFCVHLAETVIVAGLAMAFGLRLVLTRAWGRAGRLLLVGALAGVPFALAMALQLGTIASNTRVFWIAGGLDAARWAIENEVVANLAANPVLTLTGLAGLVLLFGQDLARRRLSARSALVLTLGAGLALAVAMLVAIHLHRPFLLSRYLVALHPPAGMILAVGAASLIERLGRRGQAALLVALVAGAGWAMVGQLARVERLTSWDGTGAAIARIVQACPRTQVHPDTAWNRMTLELPPRDNREVIPFAYRWIAARHGFALAPAGSRTREGACPTVFWTEHVAGQSPSAGAIAASLRARGFAIGAGYVQRIGDGWILVVPAQG